MPNQDGSIESLDLRALKAGELPAWRAAWPSFWAIALQSARHPRAGLLSWEAEDVASDAMEELIARIDATSSIQQAKALLSTIATRRAIDLARHKSAKKRRLPMPGENDIYAPGGEMSELERAEMVLLVDGALESLDAQAKLLLIEKIGQQSTYREISHRHGLPIGTVCTKVARALAKVRAALQQSSAQVKEMRSFLR